MGQVGPPEVAPKDEIGPGRKVPNVLPTLGDPRAPDLVPARGPEARDAIEGRDGDVVLIEQSSIVPARLLPQPFPVVEPLPPQRRPRMQDEGMRSGRIFEGG